MGVNADECCTEASNFSDVLQSLYMLFSLSCLTLVIVYSKMAENDMKHLLRTQVSWCAHVEDYNAVAGNCIHCHITMMDDNTFLNILIIFNISNIDKEVNKELP